MLEFFKQQWVFSTVLAAVMFLVVLTLVAYASLFERKVAAWVQDRHGPNRVGFFGLFGRRVWGLGQPIADGIKFFTKEDVVPAHADKPLYIAAPAIALFVASLGMAVIPWGGWVDLSSSDAPGPIDVLGDGSVHADVAAQIASIDIGLLFLLGVGAMGVYGIVLGGWASNNKYSLYGALRACAQMISYEIPLGLAILVVVLMAGTMRLEEIILAQVGPGHVWYVVMHPVAFLMLWVAMFAETNRMPFDLPEAEQELVSGFMTEYSSMKFSMFFMGEYTHMIIGAAFLSSLFCGGWHLPFVPGLHPEDTSLWAMLLKMLVMVIKVIFFMFLYMLIRWTVPRFRFDQLMRACWQKMIPLGVGLVLVAIVVVYVRGPGMPLWQELLWCWGGNVLVLVLAAIWSLIAQMRGKRLSGRQENMPRISMGAATAGGS